MPPPVSHETEPSQPAIPSIRGRSSTVLPYVAHETTLRSCLSRALLHRYTTRPLKPAKNRSHSSFNAHESHSHKPAAVCKSGKPHPSIASQSLGTEFFCSKNAKSPRYSAPKQKEFAFDERRRLTQHHPKERNPMAGLQRPERSEHVPSALKMEGTQHDY